MCVYMHYVTKCVATGSLEFLPWYSAIFASGCSSGSCFFRAAPQNLWQLQQLQALIGKSNSFSKFSVGPSSMFVHRV